MAASLVVAASAHRRLDRALDALTRQPPGEGALVVGASRGAADELAWRATRSAGVLFNVARMSFGELVAKLALPDTAGEGLAAIGALGEEAVTRRAVFEAQQAGELAHFAPVAALPGFARSAAVTLAELQLAQVPVQHLAAAPQAGRDLQALLTGVSSELARVRAVNRAQLLEVAAGRLRRNPAVLPAPVVLLLDVAIASDAEASFLRALVLAAERVVATAARADQKTRAAFAAAKVREHCIDEAPDRSPPVPVSSLERLQQHLFAPSPPSPGASDTTVQFFSAPGESREAVEIVRRVLDEAQRGVPFDEIAVLLRSPQTYLGVVEHAFERAGVPAWFHRGTRRPDPAGRALLALLACADEALSAQRFAEYVSLGQVPDNRMAAGPWALAGEAVLDALLPPHLRVEELQPEDDRAAASARGETGRDLAGTLRTPWRWEHLLVEAAVIGGVDRWQRRLDGLAHDYRRRLAVAEADDPGSPRARALRRDTEQLDALRAFALPVLEELAAWPAAQTWGAWLDALQRLAPRVLAQPTRVLRVLQELSPLDAVGPVRLRDVRDLLAPRLSTLSHEPPRRRLGRVFVGTPDAARGRSFQTVFVPGLAERLFPQRIREDALLLDEERVLVGEGLLTHAARTAHERLQLALAAGAARERLCLSFPRVETSEARARVPSFYVLDAVRAVEGTIPSTGLLTARAARAGDALLAWPAPSDPAAAIDETEHDLATLRTLLRAPARDEVRGRARYLFELSPPLQRSLAARWRRWRPAWHRADGLLQASPAIAPALARQRLGARPYSLTALQRFSACPYQFLLAAIYRLAPLTPPAPLQRLDPMTRGDLVHRMQAAALRLWQEHRLLPLRPGGLPRARALLDWAVTGVEREAFDLLAPAIERVWRDEIAAIVADLRLWLDGLGREGQDWLPDRFEFGFGLSDPAEHDPSSVAAPARVDGRFLLRGSIDLVERHLQTRLLRVTDWKTGRNRTARDRTTVDGGRLLQPVLYGLALEAVLEGERVYAGRLAFCTSAGNFSQHEIPLLDHSRRTGIQVLEIIDRSIEQGQLAPCPAHAACTWCDFQTVCGRNEEVRVRRKHRGQFPDLDALRALD